MRKGFTLLELLIVIIVIGILATIAIPQFLNAVEKGRIAKAKNALGLIASAEKMFRAEQGTYQAFTDPGAHTALGEYIELIQVDNDRDWDYAVTGNETTFIITATKDRAPSNTTTIILDQDGVCSGSHPLRGPDCGG